MFLKSRRPRVIALALGLVLAMTLLFFAGIATALNMADNTEYRVTYKPMLTGKKWTVVGGLPIESTAGAMMFMKGGNAVDAAAAMLGAVSVMSDGTHFGGEGQVLIYDPIRQKVFGINGMGAAPTGATPEFYIERGYAFPPRSLLGAPTPGIPGTLMTMLAEFGTLSLAEVLEPAIDLAEGYVVFGYMGRSIATGATAEQYEKWKYAQQLFSPNPPEYGKILVQRNLANTFRKLVAAEQKALKAGKSRKEAIVAAYDRFYKGDIAAEIARSVQEGGGLMTVEDLANWKCYIEEPLMTTYHGFEVYKLQPWTQGPVLLQMLNILEGIDLEAMGHNSLEYIHTLYQVMNLAYADRDFYYGDPYFPPEEPMKGLLSKEYAAERRKLIDPNRNDPNIGPGDPYPYQDEKNPYLDLAKARWGTEKTAAVPFDEEGWMGGTTSVATADINGWFVAMTPSGGRPNYITGSTGVGLGRRMESFVLDPSMNPFNVVEPGKRPRVTLTPTIVLKDGRPFLSVAKAGGDWQDQAQLMLILNVLHFGMNIQEAMEASKFCSYQMHSSFSNHAKNPGRIKVGSRIPQEVIDGLKAKGYDVVVAKAGDISYDTAPGGEVGGCMAAVLLDWDHQTLLGASALTLERHGITW